MKRVLTNFNKWLLPLVAVAAIVSCEEDKTTDPNTTTTPGEVEGITVTDIIPTYNSVTFTVVADDALAIAYIAVKAGTELTAQEVFDQGDAKGSTSGTFTYKGDGLSAETDYTLYVASKTASGNVGPAGYSFTTEVNTGAASSDQAAGIRVESIGTNTLTWEITNGSDVDFSLTMVQPTILMENDCYEMAKSGISETVYISSIMTSEDYGYLVRETAEAGGVAAYNYTDVYSTYPMYPDARYTIYALGCKGDYDDLTSIETLELTKLEVNSESITRIGNPYVDVALRAQYFTGLSHTLTPNDDAKYWTKFFTQTSEIDEFVAYYDQIEGAGAGRLRLKEYIQQIDPYVYEQYGETEISMTLGWGYEGIEFSRLALGFDANLMPGDEYGESSAMVLERNGEDGEYKLDISGVGAGNFTLTTTLEPNCFRVYWKLIEAGSYDSIVSDPTLAAALAETLDYEGWVEFRSDANGQEDYVTNANQDTQYIRESFVYDELPDYDFQIVSTSLNYGGVLSAPTLSEAFHTLPRTLGNFEPSLTITADESAVSKTSILVNYQVHDDAEENDERVFFHRFISADDEIFELSEDEIREWLLEDNGYTNANCWLVVSNDSEHEDKYNYHFNWAGMDPGTTYNYIYCTENGKGEISNLGVTSFTTLSNDGGENPELTISIDPESIAMVDEVARTFAVEGNVVANSDVIDYVSIFIEEATLLSYRFDTDDVDDLNYGLYQLVTAEGIPYYDSAEMSSNTLDADGRVWLVAQGNGADGAESKLSYVCFKSDGTVDTQVDVELSPSWVSAATATKSLPFLAVERIKSCYSDRSMLGAGIPVVSSVKREERRITESESAKLRAKGIPFYTLRELTHKAILKEDLRK